MKNENLLILDCTKILIIGGENNDGILDSVEIVDLSGADSLTSSCNIPKTYPMKVTEATGVLLEHNTVIICGGSSVLWWQYLHKECFVLTNEGFEFLVNMTEPRTSAQSIVLHDEKMLIIGGEDKGFDAVSQSMEILSLTDLNTKPSSIPTKPLVYHAMVSINDTMGMIIGGNNGNSEMADTFFFSKDGDAQEPNLVPGPLLNEARVAHAAGKITDHGNSKVGIVVIGGTQNTEILWDLSPNGKWETGKVCN